MNANDSTPSNRIPRCQAGCRKRDTHRYSGGKKGYTLRYNVTQCVRKSVDGTDYCKQHQTSYRYIVRPAPRPYIDLNSTW